MRFDHILSMLGSGWAILPENLEAMAAALEVMLLGGSPDLEQFARLGMDQSSGDEDLPYELRGGVAVVPVVGTLVKRNSFFSCFGTYGEVRAAVEQALADPRALAVLLCIDSPGGTVDGCQETAEFVKSADAVKPVYAYADGLMASAACWIGSQAREAAAPPTAIVGSIGVLSMHIDRSGADDKAGLKRTYVTAGAYKAAGHDAAPLSSKDRKVIQALLDDAYALFVGDVAAARGLSTDGHETWADGKVFRAEAAKDVGLIDHVMNLEAFLERIQAQLAQGQSTKGVKTMDVSKLKAEHPDIVSALKAEHRAEFEAEQKAKAPDVEKAKAEAAQAERESVLALAEGAYGKDVATALGARMEALDKAGLSASQVKALAASGMLAQAAGGDGKDGGFKAKMYDAITKAGAQGVDPGKPGDKVESERQARVNAMAAGMKEVG